MMMATPNKDMAPPSRSYRTSHYNMINRPAPQERQHDKPASVRGIDSSNMGRLINRDHAIQEQDGGAEEAEVKAARK